VVYGPSTLLDQVQLEECPHAVRLYLFLIMTTASKWCNMWYGVVLKTIPENEPLGAKGPLLVGEEVRKDDVGQVRS
jgi:hypothetical protein